LKSKLQKLFIAFLVVAAAAVFAVILFPLLFMALVLVFAITTLKRWRETDFRDDEFD
jgi:Flp pilus assembly protein TadB